MNNFSQGDLVLWTNSENIEVICRVIEITFFMSRGELTRQTLELLDLLHDEYVVGCPIENVKPLTSFGKMLYS